MLNVKTLSSPAKIGVRAVALMHVEIDDRARDRSIRRAAARESRRRRR